MANLLTELELHDRPLAMANPPRRSWIWLPKLIAFLLALLWLANIGISLLITHTRLQQRITGRLETVFGRPVEVGRYDFSLWGGPTLEAQPVTFAEDPRFGHEYFLRAESVTVRLRWQSLLRGHMEIGTVSLTKPSLNLVRNSDGDWNLAEWLPRPPVALSSSAAPPQLNAAHPSGVRFTRLEVDAGRINFKRGDEKIPFAFIAVSGYVEPDGPGRWRVNLQATPARAALALQIPGTIYLSGSLGGTSSRLRPAVLDLAWGEASVSDVLRLFRGYDFGVRGNVAAVVHAETQGDVWNLQARSQLRELHRWDLALRPDNPAFDINARMTLSPLASTIAITDATIEAPASFARGTANFDWADAEDHSASFKANRIDITQSQIDWKDALAWLRGFHPDVAADVSVVGTANATASFAGWPPRLANATTTIKTAELSSPRLRVPARVSQFRLRYDPSGISLAPALLVFGGPDEQGGSFRFDSSANPASHDSPAFHLAGSLPQVRDLIATASALGWNISRGWDLSGPVRCDLRWPARPLGGSLPWNSQPVGTIEWGTDAGNATLLTPFLNHPVQQIRAKADLKLDSRHIALAAADAFGANWSGTFDHRDDGLGWQFAVNAGPLAASDLDRWLNPRWRESFIYRVLPFLNPQSPTNSVPENFRASGHLSIDEFTLAPIVLHRLHADLAIGGRHLEVSNAKALLFGGTLDGAFDAELAAAPVYRIAAEFSRVDLAALTAGSPSLATLFAGSASGDIALNFFGTTPAKLLSSLQCSASMRIDNPEIRALDLNDTLHDAALRPGSSSFRDGTASFTCDEQKINFQELSLTGPTPGIQGSGFVNFDRTLDLQLHFVEAAAPERGTRHSQNTLGYSVNLTGSLAAPSVRRIESKATRP